MVATTAVPLHRLFDGLIPPELITAYDHLLATGGCAKDTAPAELGGPAIVAASPTPAWRTWLRPATPDLALLGVLAAHQTQLARDQERVLQGHRRLAEAQASYPAPMTAK